MALEQLTILSFDTAEDVVAMTGMKLEEILEIYRETMNFGQRAVYWRAGDKWFTLRVAKQFITAGVIDQAVLDMLEHHSSMKLET